ncbi:hypothetical protein [Calothrix sp. 336/3]|nr:hypothetical protein [Calothrix sp. 336/3]
MPTKLVGAIAISSTTIQQCFVDFSIPYYLSSQALGEGDTVSNLLSIP